MRDPVAPSTLIARYSNRLDLESEHFARAMVTTPYCDIFSISSRACGMHEMQILRNCGGAFVPFCCRRIIPGVPGEAKALVPVRRVRRDVQPCVA